MKPSKIENMRKRNPTTIDRREEGVPSPVPEVVSDVDNEDEESDRVSYDGEEKISDRVVEKDREEPDCDPLTQTFLVFVLFLVGMTVTGCRPITLRWAKNGNEKYPFMIASWVVMVKLIVVVLSVLMYVLTEYHKRRQAWDVVELKVKDLDRMKRASRKGVPLPDLTPRRLRSDSWSSQIVVVCTTHSYHPSIIIVTHTCISHIGSRWWLSSGNKINTVASFA